MGWQCFPGMLPEECSPCGEGEEKTKARHKCKREREGEGGTWNEKRAARGPPGQTLMGKKAGAGGVGV